jgi:hypothetical protein
MAARQFKHRPDGAGILPEVDQLQSHPAVVLEIATLLTS